jgi:DNA polymerase-3 subunit alpha (Gram-positive type)
MACLAYIVEPDPARSGLGQLCDAIGLPGVVAPHIMIERVVVIPEANTWRVFVGPSPAMEPKARSDLSTRLAEALGLSQVELVWAHDADIGSQDEAGWAAAHEMAAALEAEPALPEECDSDDSQSDEQYSDERYMEAIMQRIRDSQQEQDTGAGEQRSAAEEVVLGQRIAQGPQPMHGIEEEERSVVVRGRILTFDVREMRSGRRLVTFDVTDYTDSLSVKAFVAEHDEWANKLRVGTWLIMRGPVQYDKFTQELTLLPRDISIVPAPPGRQDDAAHKRVELHLHTKMSAMDGVADVAMVVAQASAWGHPAVAITDHGVVQAFPEAAAAAKKHGIKILYGTEGYLADQPEDRGHAYHIVVIASTQEGLQNLYRLVSLAHIEHFYRRPRMLRSELAALRQGLLLGSACEAGELYQAVLAGASDSDLDKIAAFYDYLEIQPLANNRFYVDNGRVASEETLRDINRRILATGRRLGKPVVATSDAHYIHPEDDIYRRILMAGHGFSDVESTAPLFFKTTDEMLAEFAYLGEADAYRVVVEAPEQVAAMVDDLRPIPEGFYPPVLEGAGEEIRRMCEENGRQLYGNPLPEIVATRLQKELSAIVGNGFASLYLIAHKLVKKSVDDGYLVGSRGSVGSSLVARLCGISEVNPLPPHYFCPSCHYFDVVDDGSTGAGADLPPKDCATCGRPLCRDGFDIPFETFLGFEGESKIPDIDLNFSGEYQARAHRYTEELFGKENVFRAGTVGTLAEKTAYGYVRKYLDERGEQARTAEINRLSLGISGVRKTTGQHPGGIMVVPEGRQIYEFTPVQHPANDKTSGVITTHFAFTYVHDQLLKLDILGHDGPTMIRLLEEMTGVKSVDIPLDDPATMSIFSGLDALRITPAEAGGTVGTLAIPEYNTRFVRQMLEDTRPQSFADLVRIMGLSHGTDVWLNNNQDLVKAGTITLAETIACRDDIMSYLIRKGLPAGRAFNIMEQVRRGRGLSAEDEALMNDHGVPQWYVESCRKIRYMFPKAHAAAYAVMAYWQAYFKVHHPTEFYAAYFTTRASEFDAQLVIQGRKAIRKALQQLEEKGSEATGKERGLAVILEVVLEAMARGVRFHPVEIYLSDASRFLPAEGGLRPPLISLQGVGGSVAESLAKARAGRPFTSLEDLRKRSGVPRSVVDALVLHGAVGDLPDSDQLSLF